MNIALSATMRQAIPTRPREIEGAGSRSNEGTAVGMLMKSLGSLFVAPVRIRRMLYVPQRPAAPDLGYSTKIVGRGRRGGGPFERPGIPRIAARDGSVLKRPNDVEYKNRQGGALKERSHRANKIQRTPASVRFVCVDPARHAENSRHMHRIESEMKSDDE